MNEPFLRNDTNFADEVRKFKYQDILKIDGVVHTHCMRPDLLGFFLSLKKSCRVFSTAHNFFLFDVGFGRSKHLVYFLWLLWKFSVSRFEAVVSISEPMLRYYRKKMPKANHVLIHNFRGKNEAISSVDNDLLEWVKLNRSMGRKLLVFVGSVSERKNVLIFSKILSLDDQVSIAVIGTGPLEEKLKDEVVEAGCADRIFFAGHVKNPSSILIYFDALILPSHAEGFPLVVIEAASVGIPSLLSNIAVHRELERLGFGVVFDHKLLKNFSVFLNVLINKYGSDVNDLTNVWSKSYTPEAGAKKYVNLFERQREK
nr:glycosyltransferase family 4 protein [Chromobacterium violaceum]